MHYGVGRLMEEGWDHVQRISNGEGIYGDDGPEDEDGLSPEEEAWQEWFIRFGTTVAPTTSATSATEVIYAGGIRAHPTSDW